MQCPSCGFENMPGRAQCAVCSTSLTAGPKPEGTMPPRAKNRTWGQRFRYTMGDAPVLTSAGRWLAARSNSALRWARQPGSFNWLSPRRSGSWTWLDRRAVGLILLSAIPGFFHWRIVGRRQTGAILFLSALASILIAAACYRTPVCDALLWSTIGLSMWSMYVAVDHLRPDSRNPADRTLATAGVWMLILALYTGSYVALQLALSPVVMTMQVNAAIPNSGLEAGDTALIIRRNLYQQGEIVVGGVNWQNREVPTIGPIIGMPGDTLVLSDRLYVNGKPIEVRLPPLGAPHGGLRPYSAQEVGQIRLGRNHYWILPQFNVAPTPQAVLDTGRVSRSTITGRLLAITSPANHRSWVR